MRKTRIALLSGLLVSAAPLVWAQAQDGSIVRKVDVVVRTVTAVITDDKGQPLASDPLPADLDVVEDGQKCEILGVEPVRSAGAVNAPESARPAAGVASSPEGASKGRRQVLYVDAGFQRLTSVKEAAAAFASQVDALVALGSLEIVVADPEARLFFPASRSPEAIRGALAGLASNVRGRDRILALRRQTLAAAGTTLRLGATASPFAEDSATPLGPATAASAAGDAADRGAISEEIALIRSGLRRLSRWATSSSVPAQGILYLASDGFDADLTSFYSKAASEPVRNEMLTPLQAEIRATEQALLAGGWTTVPVALGGSVGTGFAQGAEFAGRGHVANTLNTSVQISFADHPLDPLRGIAEATGGELLVSGDQLKGAVTRFSRAYEVSFRVSRIPDGKLHKLVLKSRKKGMLVRSVRAIPVGTIETASASRALDVLESGPASLGSGPVAGRLPVKLAMTARRDETKNRVGGHLEVKVLIREIRPLLARVGDGRMRVSVAVEIPGQEPFVTHDEQALPKDVKDGWLLELPMVWPKGATRMAVVAEELATGSSGTAMLDLTKP
ncbi:MAG: hypothetical protein ABIT01_12395 [Thermoanaerobaculia bacterium]